MPNPEESVPSLPMAIPLGVPFSQSVKLLSFQRWVPWA